MEWIALVATFLGGGLLGTIITAWQGGTSEYYADVRHLRDLQEGSLKCARQSVAKANRRAVISIHSRRRG
jgi:hypothetical protein